MRVVRCIRPIFLLLLAVANLPSFGQTSFGSIVGTVTDPSGAAIGGATVELTNIGTSERRTATTESSGNFNFVNLIPGDYRVNIQQPGFKRYSREPIRIEVGSAVRVDAPLQVGDVAEVPQSRVRRPSCKPSPEQSARSSRDEQFRILR